MDTKEYAQKILSIKFDFDHYQKIENQIKDYKKQMSLAIIHEFLNNYDPRNNQISKAIKDINNIFGPKHQDFIQKKFKISSNGTIHRVDFFSTEKNKMEYSVFIGHNMIIIVHVLHDDYNILDQYPYQKGYLTNYQPGKYDLDNAHNKIDLHLKLESSLKHKKINYLTFVLKEFMNIYSRGIFNYNNAFLQNVLDKINALALLDPEKPETFLKNEIFELKEIITDKINYLDQKEKKYLNLLFEYLNFDDKKCVICKEIKNKSFKKIYTDKIVTVIFSEKTFDFKITPKEHIHQFDDIHHEYYSHLSRISYFINKIIKTSHMIQKSYIVVEDDSSNHSEDNHLYISLKFDLTSNTPDTRDKFINFLNQTDVCSYIESHGTL